MHLIAAGLNHKTAPVSIRERCAFSRPEQQAIYREFAANPAVDAAVMVITCNRTEIYASVQDEGRALCFLETVLETHSGMDPDTFRQYLYIHAGQQAAVHLFSVAAGLDSMILGEQQILGQIKEAYQDAVAAGSTDGLLNMLFQAALHAGKKVRAETGISRYPVSISSAAVELCREIFSNLEDLHVLVVGAGDTAELTVRHLMAGGARSVIVSNRCFDHARELAASVGGTALHLDAIPDELTRAHIVIGCTSAPHFVIHGQTCEQALHSRSGRDIVMIDIAVPRDIDPGLAAMPGVFLYDIDDLQNVVDRSFRQRLQAAHQARAIIDEEARLFMKKISALPVVPVIFALKQQAEHIKQEELQCVLAKLAHLSEHDRQAVAGLAQAIAGKLLHEPVTCLKKNASESQGRDYARMIAELFNLNLDDNDEARTTGNPRK